MISKWKYIKGPREPSLDFKFGQVRKQIIMPLGLSASKTDIILLQGT